MEKGTLGLIAAGGIAVWAFFSLTQTQGDERREIRATIERDSAEIDRDFARLTGDSKEQQNQMDARAAEANSTLTTVKQEAEARRKLEEQKRDSVQESLEEDVKIQGGPSQPAAAAKLLKLNQEVSK